jgi:hypothetical protein
MEIFTRYIWDTTIVAFHYVHEKIVRELKPPPLVGGGWGEGDNPKEFQKISPPPQPSPIKGEGEKL